MLKIIESAQRSFIRGVQKLAGKELALRSKGFQPSSEIAQTTPSDDLHLWGYIGFEGKFHAKAHSSDRKFEQETETFSEYIKDHVFLDVQDRRYALSIQSNGYVVLHKLILDVGNGYRITEYHNVSAEYPEQNCVNPELVTEFINEYTTALIKNTLGKKVRITIPHYDYNPKTPHLILGHIAQSQARVKVALEMVAVEAPSKDQPEFPQDWVRILKPTDLGGGPQ